MADCDEDSPRLRANLTAVLESVAEAADRRDPLTLETIKRWHADTMAGLNVPDGAFVGRFRGEPGLETVRAYIDALEGSPPDRVADDLVRLIDTLNAATERLDRAYPGEMDLDVDGREAVVELAAWAHSEWVRIHPFANGNGRTARILTNALLMRYGIPPVLRLRPRPNEDYERASAAAMIGDVAPMTRLLRRLVSSLRPPP